MQVITQEWRFQVFDVHQMEYAVGWAVFVSSPFSKYICFSQVSIWHVLTPRNASEREKACLQSTAKEIHTKASCKNVAFLFQGFSPVQWGAEPNSAWPVYCYVFILLWFHDLVSFHGYFLQVGFYRWLLLSVQRST